MPVRKEPLCFIQVMRGPMVEAIESNLAKFPELAAPLNRIKEKWGINYKQELEWILKIKPSVKTRVVFSHNDVNNGNILVDSKDPSNVCVIDMYMSSFGYRGTDIGSFFVYMMMKTTAPDLSSGLEFPNREKRVQFVQAYIEEYKKLNVVKYDPSLDSLEVIMKDSLFNGLVYGLLLCLWIIRDAEKYAKEWPPLLVSQNSS